jgi:L-threonylcarbamoyladenylate synthase
VLRLASAGIADAAGAAARVLRAGGIVLHPTDTVYGLACLAGRPQALRRLYDLKGRGKGKPSLLLVGSVAMAKGAASSVPATAGALMRALWPGPLTIVVPAAGSVPPLVRGRGNTVGLRLPAHRFTREMVRLAGGPVVSTSANRAGEQVPGTQRALVELFGGRVGLIVLGGPRRSSPSTVVKVSPDNRIEVIRAGAIHPGRLSRIGNRRRNR